MSNYRQDPFINLDGIQKIQQELGRLFEGDWVKPSSRYNESGDWSPATDAANARMGGSNVSYNYQTIAMNQRSMLR